VIKVQSNREYFTRHGLHLNNEGEEQVIRKVANVITTMFQEHIEEPIRLLWKMEHNEKKWPLQYWRKVVESLIAGHKQIEHQVGKTKPTS
jgi:hypothetical protein